MRLLVVNGPNLDMLGTREPDIYGATTLGDLESQVKKWAGDLGVDVETRQSNDEAEIIGWVHEHDGDGMVINPGAFTHTSRAIADAIAAVPYPVVEVHISNVRAREPWRAHSVMSDVCVRTIFGRGVSGYRHAMRHLLNRSAMGFETIRYGPHADNVGDLRGDGDDLVVLVHGGLWKLEHERDGMESIAVALARRGLRTWNLEYRRLGNGGGWPGSGHDVLTALDAIPGLGLAARRVVAISHSAGAYLTTWAATRARPEIDIHVALGPIFDLEAAVENDDVGAAECARLLERGAPRVDPGGTTTVVVHGDADQIVPVQRSADYAAANGLEHHRTGIDHFSVLDPTTPEWGWIVDRLDID